MTRPKSSGRQKLFGGRVVGGPNLTVAEMAAHSKLLSLLGRLWLLPRFTGHTPAFVSLHCVESQSTPWKRYYSEWAATLRPLQPKHRPLPWKSDGQKILAWIILALTASNKTPSEGMAWDPRTSIVKKGAPAKQQRHMQGLTWLSVCSGSRELENNWLRAPSLLPTIFFPKWQYNSKYLQHTEFSL